MKIKLPLCDWEFNDELGADPNIFSMKARKSTYIKESESCWIGILYERGLPVFGFTWNTEEEFDTVKADIEKIIKK